MTLDTFLEWPGDGLRRLHALIDGQSVAGNPGAVRHGVIPGEITWRLGSRLATTRPACRVLIEPGVQPRVVPSKKVRIPDLVVACRPEGQGLLANPLEIVEILSPGNVRETREAICPCLTTASLREVLLIDSVRMRAEYQARSAEGTWPPKATPIGPAEDIALDCLGFRLSLAALDEGLTLSGG